MKMRLALKRPIRGWLSKTDRLGGAGGLFLGKLGFHPLLRYQGLRLR
jgi:hypothetical protein